MGVGFSGAGVEHQEDLVAVRPKHDVVKNEEMWIDGIDEDGDEVVEIDIEDMEGEAGKRVVKKILDPMLPSRAEVREHDLTHLPYRNWCPHCIKGNGKELGIRGGHAMRRAWRSTTSTIVFQEMTWASRSRF